MWGIVKALVVAAVAGAGAGILAKGRIDAALKGEAPKKVKKPKIQIVELPADVEVDNIVVQTKARPGAPKKPAAKRRAELPPADEQEALEADEVESD